MDDEYNRYEKRTSNKTRIRDTLCQIYVHNLLYSNCWNICVLFVQHHHKTCIM